MPGSPLYEGWDRFTRVWANPDGTLFEQIGSGPIQEPDPSSATGWSDIDLSLEAGSGSIHPRVADASVAFSAGGAGDLASVSSSAGGVALGWPDSLPPPTLQGAVATYGSVASGIDMTLRALPDGFEQSFVVSSPPSAPLVFDLPLALQGLSASVSSDGRLVLLDGSGKQVGGGDPPMMWGAALDPGTEQPLARAPVGMSLVQGGSGLVLELTPPMSFFSQAGVRFPVTIDPVVSLSPATDGYISSFQPTTSFSTGTELHSGFPISNPTVISPWLGEGIDRSILSFPTSDLAGATILEASLSLHETWSASCTPSEVDLYAAAVPEKAQAADLGPPTWATQPPAVGPVASTTAAYGFSSACPAQDLSLSGGALGGLTLPAAIQGWADGTLAPVLEVRAGNEADSNGWKVFASSRAGTQSPLLSVTLDSPIPHFIVVCKYTGTTLRVDPIVDRGSASTDHPHIFFGNTQIKEVLHKHGAGGLTDDHVESAGAGGHTTCRDKQDTSAMWFPEVLTWNGSPGTGKPYTHNLLGTIYVRVYYSDAGPKEHLKKVQCDSNDSSGCIPEVLQMANGYPHATGPASDMQDVFWDCGAAPGLRTFKSRWPYDCTLNGSQWPQGSEDGLVLHINFPPCLNPNGNHNEDGGPWYVNSDFGLTKPNDLAFYTPDTHSCPSGYGTFIGEVSIHLHLLISTPQINGWSGKASCDDDTPTHVCTNNAPSGDDVNFYFADCKTPPSCESGQSPGYYTAHGDWMQTWQQGDPSESGEARGTLDDLVEDCLNETPDPTCSGVSDQTIPNG